MFTLNRMTIHGSVGQDPDIRTMNSGSRVASFPVATNDSYKDTKTGEYKKQPNGIRLLFSMKP